MGGQQAGATAARMAAQIVHDRFYEARQAGQEIHPALEQALQEANRRVYQEAQRQGVERMVREAVPEVTVIHDVTDHSSGENPYFEGPVV